LTHGRPVAGRGGAIASPGAKGIPDCIRREGHRYCVLGIVGATLAAKGFSHDENFSCAWGRTQALQSRHHRCQCVCGRNGDHRPAWAAAPGFCQGYARSAVAEFYRARENPACGAPFDVRWHSNFNVHYDWCLRTSVQVAQSESDARRQLLGECTGRRPDPVGGDANCCPENMLVCPAGRHWCK
jgi:hypothetical protein